tara:strand:+ start:1252 stop:1923 length:672 start_codon:yes stop_codon:yes gene_type:complete
MQPTYLPWPGYFNLILKSDAFIFLDDSQFQKNSWHNRNRILVQKKPHWITVPVEHKTLVQKINETKIANNRIWGKKHCKLIQQSYCKHPFSNEILDIINLIDNQNFSSLSDLNTRLILWFLEKLKITTKIYFSSKLGIVGKRTQRIINFLEYLDADTYLSPIGASEYLKSDGFSDLTTRKLEFQEFTSVPYAQHNNKGFHPFLSIVDLVANIGWESTKTYLKF